MADRWTVAPILRVRDVRAAAAHYRDILGFDVPDDRIQDGLGDEGAIYAICSRDGVEIHLGRRRAGWQVDPGERPNAIGAYLRVPDVRALHDELASRGARIVQAPTAEPWGDLVIVVLDLDGYVLSFASSPG